MFIKPQNRIQTEITWINTGKIFKKYNSSVSRTSIISIDKNSPKYNYLEVETCIMRKLKQQQFCVSWIWYDINIITNLYLRETTKIRIETELTEEMEFSWDVSQGRILILDLFKIYIESICQEALSQSRDGKLFNNNWYLDGICR